MFVVLDLENDLDAGDTCVGSVSLVEEGVQVSYALVSWLC
jgi:hypothetical protein